LHERRLVCGGSLHSRSCIRMIIRRPRIWTCSVSRRLSACCTSSTLFRFIERRVRPGQRAEPGGQPAHPSDMSRRLYAGADGGPNAPIYVSTDGGNTWSLRMVSLATALLDGDITVGFATTGGTSMRNPKRHDGRMQILRTSNFASTTTMAVLVDRDSEDQPWVVAGSVVVGRSRRSGFRWK